MLLLPLLALVVVGCGPPAALQAAANAEWRAKQEAERASAERSKAWMAGSTVAYWARALQDNPYTSRRVHADPMPCARDFTYAEANNLPWPACDPYGPRPR